MEKAAREHGYRKLCNFEIGFGSAADGADPVFGNIFESGSWSDTGIRIANSRVVFISTEVADILFHGNSFLGLTPVVHGEMLDAVIFFGTLAIVETIDRSNKVAGDPPYAFKFYSCSENYGF